MWSFSVLHCKNGIINVIVVYLWQRVSILPSMPCHPSIHPLYFFVGGIIWHLLCQLFILLEQKLTPPHHKQKTVQNTSSVANKIVSSSKKRSNFSSKISLTLNKHRTNYFAITFKMGLFSVTRKLPRVLLVMWSHLLRRYIMSKRATPDQLMRYKLSLCVHKLYNQIT